MTRTQLAETNEEGNPVEFSEWSRPSSTRNRALLRIRGGLAWKYLDVTLGGMLAPQGGLGGLVLPRGLGDGAGERRGVENFLLPAFGLKIGPFKHLYASADFLNGEATVLSEGLLSAGLGFQNQATDVRLSLALGVVSGTKAVLHLEQQWKAVTFLATASVLLDVDAQKVGPLRPGDWADLGLALRVPLAMPH